MIAVIIKYSGYFLMAVGFWSIAVSPIINLFPELEIVKGKMLLPLAKWLKFKRLQKSAIKSDTQGRLNAAFHPLMKRLPEGWLKEIKVEWVSKEDTSDFFQDGQTVIRMRPVENQAENLVNAINHSIRASLFRESRNFLPENQYEAAVLYVSRRVAEQQGGDTKKAFEKYLEPIICQKEKILDYLNRFSNIDQRGFLLGLYFKEINDFVVEKKLQLKKSQINSEVNEVLKHIETFVKHFKEVTVKTREVIPESEWIYNGSACSFAIILVAHPMKLMYGAQQYLNRVNKCKKGGAKKLYLFSSEKEKTFANGIVQSIGEIEGFTLSEFFDTEFDYRGDRGGAIAVFNIE